MRLRFLDCEFDWLNDGLVAMREKPVSILLGKECHSCCKVEQPLREMKSTRAVEW